MNKYLRIIGILVIFIIVLVIINYINISIEVRRIYEKAKLRAESMNRELIVLGSPYSASGKFLGYIMKTYGCGDICIDMNCCKGCVNDICGKVDDVLYKFESNKYVIFESGLLEVVDRDKLSYIIEEIYRVCGSKDNIFSSHYIQNYKWYFRNIYKYIYKYAGEGDINQFVDKYPPNELYKIEFL